MVWMGHNGLVPESEKTRGQVSRSGDEQPAQREICCGTGLENSFEMKLVSKDTNMCLDHLKLQTSTYSASVTNSLSGLIFVKIRTIF